MASEFRDKSSMRTAAIEEESAEWLSLLEGRARARGYPAVEARKAVAREIGCAPGSLENIKRRRTKGIRVWLADKIREAVIRALESEIRSLEAQLQVARQCGAHPASDEILEAEASIASAKKIMRGT